MAKNRLIEEDIHSEDLQEIISKPPSWLLQRGISMVLGTILLIIGLSVFIRYPEIVKAELKFNTKDAPKTVVNRHDGILTKILVADGEKVEAGTDLVFLESTGDHRQVLTLLDMLKEARHRQSGLYELDSIVPPNTVDLGELQGSYEGFHLSYLNYKAVNTGGIYQEQKRVLLREIGNVRDQTERIMESYDLQQKQLDLAESEFDRYKILAEKKIISPSELEQKEALLLSKQQTIPQIESNIISSQGNLLAKAKELSALENQILEEKKKFVQSLNSFISEAEKWKKQYVLTAPSAGKLIYGSFLQENQYVTTGQILFYVNPGNDEFYGELYIPQNHSSKVRKSQDVLIKVHSYPYQEYGYLHGKIDYISDIPIQDSVFFSRVKLIRSSQDSVIKLKPGILAEAEVITDDQSVLRRIWSNLTKSLKF